MDPFRTRWEIRVIYRVTLAISAGTYPDITVRCILSGVGGGGQWWTCVGCSLPCREGPPLHPLVGVRPVFCDEAEDSHVPHLTSVLH